MIDWWWDDGDGACVWVGSRIEALTNVQLDAAAGDDAAAADTVMRRQRVGEKTVMVRAARQLLSAITKVLILADRIVIKQLLTAKDQVIIYTK